MGKKLPGDFNITRKEKKKELLKDPTHAKKKKKASDGALA
jgi:hypothetical protein